MSAQRTIEMPVAVITDAEVIFEGQRKPRVIEVRADLIAEISVIEGTAAPLAATAHLAAWPAQGPGPVGREAQRIDYRNWKGRLQRKSLSTHNGVRSGTFEIDEAMLRTILAAVPGATPPYSSLFTRKIGTSPLNGYPTSRPRQDMPTLRQVADRMPLREVVNDGTAAANRQVQQVVAGIVLIDGIVHQPTQGPVYSVIEPRSRQVVVPSGGATGCSGSLLFGPHRAEDAQAMCEWLSKRDRRGVLPRHDVIEIVDLDLVAVDEASIVVRNGFSGTWSGVGELLNALPAKCLMHWAKLRDLEISVRGGHAANAAPTMVAFRDFLDALRALRLAPYYEDRRQKYLASVRNEIHRVIEVELPRLGIAPGHGPLAAADEAALDDFGTSLGAGDLP